MKKRELTPDERAEAAALKAIFNRAKHETGLTQERAAEHMGYKTQGVVSQYLNATIPLNLPVALKFAKLLGCQVGDFSPRLASLIPQDATSVPAAAEQQRPDTKPSYTLLPIEEWDDDTPLDDDEVELKIYKTAEFSSGPGRTGHHVTDEGARLRYGKRSLRKAGVDVGTAAGGINKGISNEPLIPDGAIVMLDESKTKVVEGEPYGLDHEGEFRVKFLYPLPGGGLRLRSYNRDEFPDEDYDKDWPERIRIIGWVWTWQPPIRKWRG